MTFGTLFRADEKKETPADRSARVTIEILEQLTSKSPLRLVNIRLWDGTCWPDPSPKPATLVLNEPGALRAILTARSEVTLGEAYLNDIFDVEGNLEAAFELGDILAAETKGWTKTLSLGSLILQLPPPKKRSGHAKEREALLNGKKNSPDRDKNAVRFHYDISNEFYGLWLDPRMVYSCAYFADEETSLEQAQLRKLDLICRKLDLQPGERLLEIGSGWGGLLIHAATHYGVKADGITLSQKQLEWTERLIVQHELQDRVRVRLADYRELKEPETYDKAASVGMVEHVGGKNLPLYFRQVRSLLKPGGLFLNHGIGLGPLERMNHGETFIDHYVFPDTELISIGAMLQAAEPEHWEIRDVDSLREHYAMTLRHWVRRLEARREDALREIDETSYRIWRLYMAGSAHSFRLGYLSVYQTLLAKIDDRGFSQAPLTRANWYRKK
jgi:cyclopropane-fatty-acyl-phospholipid synthase